jgi:hypothetical protein
MTSKMKDGIAASTGKKLAHLNFDLLYTTIHGKKTTSYWTANLNLPAPVTTVDWDICHSALWSLPFSKRRWLIQHLANWFLWRRKNASPLERRYKSLFVM